MGNSQSCKWSFEEDVDAIKLFSENKSILIIESENELTECDLEVIVSKAQELLHTDKLDWIGF